MMTWKELDIEMEQEVAKSYVGLDMLRAHISVLIVKRMVTYQTPVDEIRDALATRYGVKYNPLDVSNEITCMLHEEHEANRHVLEPEDYFEGY